MNNKNTSYLAQLKFDPSLYKNLVAKYVLNFRLVFLLLIAIIALGASSFISLPRRLNPQAELPLMIVSTVLPGASPEDIESLVTIPLEDSLKDIEDLDTIESVSQDNASIITLNFEPGIDQDKTKDEIQSAVDTVTDLPEDALDPQVIKIDVENQSIWNFELTADNDLATLSRFAENLKEELEAVPSIDRVEIGGKETQEIQVLVKEEAQRVFELNAFALSTKVKEAIASYPAGEVSTDNSTFALTIDPTINSIDDIRDLRVDIGGNFVKLSQVAEISQKSKPSQKFSYLASNTVETKRSISFGVFKTKQANIDKTAKDAKDVVDKVLAQHDEIQSSTSMDLAQLISDQYDDLISNFKTTMALVFIILFLFLGIRQAFIVSLAIPLAFLVSFFVMNTVGLTLNFLSLFSLILSLGLLVDTTIVIVTAITSYWRTNKFTPAEAGLLVLRDFAAPIWATTITTVWAFLPILLSGGIIGAFIKSMPIIVSATVLASATLSILITLPLMIVILKIQIPSRVKILLLAIALLVLLVIIIFSTQGNRFLPFIIPLFIILFFATYKIRNTIAHRAVHYLSNYIDTKRVMLKIVDLLNNGVIVIHVFTKKYKDFIEYVLASSNARKKIIISVVIFSLFSYTLMPLGFVVNEFFPKADSNELFVNIKFPPGTNLKTTTSNGLNIFKELRLTNGLETITAHTGTSLDPEFMNSASSQNAMLFILALKEKDKRDISSITIAQNIRDKYENNTNGEISVLEMSGGPPVGADVQMELLGSDLQILDQKADELISFLETLEGTANINKSIEARTSKLVFVPDPDKLAQAKVSQAQIGLTLRTFSSGFTLDSVKFDGDTKLDINFRNSDGIQIPESISKINISSPNGNYPLTSLGEIELRPNPTQITREEGKRTISVSASALKGFAPPPLNAKLEEFADNKLNLPAGYSWQTGGLNEQNQQAVNDILRGMIIAAILILATMVILLGSYRKAAIVLLVIPLAISGVFIVFGLTGTPLSFPTMIGLLALFGIVVNNSILIVYKINQNLKLKMRLKKAISDASSSRVEPIFFSSLTTIIGLTPITLADPLWRGLGGAIIAGLIFSGTIMLLFIPVVYYMVFEKEIR